MGATFPFAIRGLDDGSSGAGALYAANTLGAALGAAATGFVLLPALGLRGTTFVGVVINLIAAAGFWRLGAQGAQVLKVLGRTVSTPAP